MYRGIFDTHAHYADAAFDADRDALLQSFPQEGVEAVMLCGCTPSDSRTCLELAAQYPYVYCAVGVHPENVDGLPADWYEQIKALAASEKVRAIGEIGLDFHGIFDTAHIAQMKLQMKVFERQLRLAQLYELPVVIHCRDAFFAIKEILQYTHFELKKVMFHCFVEDLEAARWVTDNGGLLSYSGVITFKRFGHTHETAIATDLSHIVIETDSPYLTPAPFRGQQNFPTYVHYVAEKLAELKGISYDECVRATTENAKRFFGF